MSRIDSQVVVLAVLRLTVSYVLRATGGTTRAKIAIGMAHVAGPSQTKCRD